MSDPCGNCLRPFDEHELRCPDPYTTVWNGAADAHGGDRLTPEERADFEEWREFITRFADMGDGHDRRMCAIIDRLAPKPEVP